MAMNKQRFTSNLFNILSYDAAGNIVLKDYSQTIRYNWNGTIHAFTGPLSISSIAAAVTDTDRFLVSDGGVLKYRTGAEVLSDIGAISGTGTSGQVVYWTGTSSQTGSNNLFWDAANARLGIGTNAPAYKLHSVGNAFINGSIFFGDASHYIDTNNSTFCMISSNRNLQLARSGTASLTITSNFNTVLQAGGTITDGGQRLQVQGDAFIKGSGATSATSALLVQNSGGTTTLTLNNAGNLGLGVTPSAWSGLSGKVLEVGTAFGDKGSIFQNDIDDLRLMSNVYFDGSFRYVRTGTATIFHSINGSYRWSTAPSGIAGNAISFTQAMTLTAGGNLLVGTTTDSGEKLQISGSGKFSASYTASGTVAIETWQRVGGAVSADMTYNDANTSMNFGTSTSHSLNIKTNNTTALSIASTGAATFSSSVTATSFIPNSSTIPTNGMYLPSANTLGFASGTSSRMVITSTGAVGIGTTSPTGLFEVKGDGASYFTRGTKSILLNPNVVGADTESFITTSTGMSFAFGTASTERMRITSGGNLLVGTTTDQGYRVQITSASADSQLNVWGATAPSIRLDNAASGATQRFVIGLATATNNFIQGANAGDVCMTPGTSSALVFGMWQTSSSSEVMRISTSSNVLIGKNTDSGQKLQVVGKVNLTSLPTSATGLMAGDVWNNGGVLNIV